MKRRYPCHCDSNLPSLPSIPADVINNLDPEYSIILNDLINSLKNTKNISQLKQIFDKFAAKYLLLPEFWRYRSRLDSSEDVTDRCLSQFYFTYFADNKHLHVFDKSGPVIWINCSDYSNLDIINLMGYQDKAKYLLNYPHEKLTEIFDFNEAFGDKILTQHEYFKYKTVLKHQKEINAAENSIKDLFESYAKINDKRIAIQNIEILLSKNPCNKWLWKTYLEFIKKSDQPKAYLDILQRYIKFFITETDMKKLFEQEKIKIEKMSNFCEMKSLSYFLIKQQKPEIKDVDKKQIYSKSFKSYHQQSFSLPMPFIRYLLTKANPRQKNILFETCKLIFLLSPTPICCNITFTSIRSTHNCIHRQSLRLSRAAPLKLKNLFVAKTLTIDSPKFPNILTEIIQRISKCQIWSLNIVGQNVSWKDLQFLISADTIKRFSFINGKIIADSDNQNLISIENVIEALPNAHTIILKSAATFTQNTFKKLAVLKFRKFEYFEIGNVDCNFNFGDFEKFVKVHFQAKSEIVLGVENSTTLKAIRKINQLIKGMLESRAPQESKPKITVF